MAAVPKFIAICTGSRDLDDRASVDTVLDDLIAAHPDLCIRVGDCPTGLDEFVRDWSRRRWAGAWRTRCRVYRADWDTFPTIAGPMRNAEMVNDGADEMHAWHAPPPALNKGTSGCVDLARRAGYIVIHEYGRETQTTTEYEQEALPL